MMDILIDFLMKAMVFAVVGEVTLVVSAPLWIPAAIGAFRVFEWCCEAFAHYEDWRDTQHHRLSNPRPR